MILNIPLHFRLKPISAQLFAILSFYGLALGGEVGLLTTSYPIPMNAVFVSPNGDNANAGTESSPLATLAAAVQRAPSGATIVMRAGTYREGDITISRQLTIQPYPEEDVCIKGSTIIDNWNHSNGVWFHDGWTHDFGESNHHETSINPEYPYAGLPDMVFKNSIPLSQVASIAELNATSFYIDHDADRIYLGASPSESTIEVARHSRGLRVVTNAADGTIIRGLRLLHYGSLRSQAILQIDAAEVTLENNSVQWGAYTGIAIFQADNCRIINNYISHHGSTGMVGWRTNNLEIANNVIEENNQENFVMAGATAEAAGIKITNSNNLNIIGNIFQHNRSNGLWLDISVFNAKILFNAATANDRNGFYHELSGTALYLANLANDNKDSGIALNNSSQIDVYNNTLANNAINLKLTDDSRLATDPADISRGISWITKDLTIKNNISTLSGSSGMHILARDYNSTPIRDGEDFIKELSHNGYHRTSNLTSTVAIEWWRGTSRTDYTTIENFQSTGMEANGVLLDGANTATIFQNRENFRYRLTSNSPLRNTGEHLPEYAAKLYGTQDFQTIDIGAYQYYRPVQPFGMECSEEYFQFCFNSTPGTLYKIESSTDLSNWLAIDPELNGDSGFTRFRDPIKNTYRNFYRVMEP